jgi:hypothetical protein
MSLCTPLEYSVARYLSTDYKTINSDQFYETRSSILEILSALTIERPFVNRRGFMGILIQGKVLMNVDGLDPNFVVLAPW